MGLKFQINIFSTLRALSAASELTDLKIFNHSERVTYITMKIAEELELSQSTKHTLMKASLLHDVGVASSYEKLLVVDLSSEPSQVAPHCRSGAKLLEETKMFANLNEVVLRHHDPWNGPSLVDEQDKPDFLSQIICIADRIDSLIDTSVYILWQKSNILDYLKQHSGTTFNPELVEIMLKIGGKDSFWLDLQTGFFQHYLEEIYPTGMQKLNLNQLEDIAQLFSKIFDRKSSFTANHSQGVANYAVQIGKEVGVNEIDLQQLKIAGLLHDLGKLALPDQLLDYPGTYSENQRLLMKQHTYQTYHLINFMGPGLNKIRDWAAYHHERLDGQGYPFGLDASQLDLGSRIIAVADITQALTENRPYRGSLPPDKVRGILRQLVAENALDPQIVEVAIPLIATSTYVS